MSAKENFILTGIDEFGEEYREAIETEWQELLDAIQRKEPIRYELAIRLSDEDLEELGISHWASSVNEQAEAGEIYPPVHFMSNHKDVSFLENHFGHEINLVPHPYIEPEWSETEFREKCAQVIARAVAAEILVMNGDYFLVVTILKARLEAGKRTGFIAMKKFNEPSNEKDSEGRIIHRNVLKPVAIRWI